MAKITIDGKEIEVENGLTLIQACEIAGIEIPRFCYHDKLKIAGNCRMCVVEVEKSPKPVASCAMPVSEGMIVRTNTPNVKKAREGVMEFLLINHPLDCPICDKGGECDLQDQSYKYGKSTSRYLEHKRGVKDKDMGPLIQTHMTRCIHCTRCVRFMEDVAGTCELGATGRGEHMEITSYLEKSIKSELSGNIIDLCPVGALNSKPYAYTARKWELKSTNSVDVFDAMGSNIKIDSRGFEVMRILPRLNEDINEEWISDRIRFSYDGLKLQRIDKAFTKQKGKLTPSTLEEAIEKLASYISSKTDISIGAISGSMTDLETMYSTKKLLKILGSNNVDFNQFGYNFDSSYRANYLFNTKYSGLEAADLILLVGCNIRKNAPVLGARLSRLEKSGNTKIYSIGLDEQEAFKSKDLGSNLDVITNLESGSGPLYKVIKNASKPVIIIGDGVYSRSDSLAILSILEQVSAKLGVVKDGWNGFNILHNHASTVGALDIGFSKSSRSLDAKTMVKNFYKGELDLLILLGSDEIEIPGNIKGEKNLGIIVYIGHHGDINAGKADIVLPGCAFTEKDATYINNEGIIQKTYTAVPGPNKAIADYQIILDLASKLNLDLGFRNLSELRKEISKELEKKHNPDKISFSSKAKISKGDIDLPYVNFYLSNSISRASKTMASCARELIEAEA
ncbi:MAG: NADH-quinone oxidoreductase subunit NuoG [Rickettsiaceae bacterium]|nr:NADH-quinone oxidoreductase subunit NuoG [Rickettsiaceae bacterium]